MLTRIFPSIRLRRSLKTAFLIVVLICFVCFTLQQQVVAAPIRPDDAATVVTNWLKLTNHPLNESPGTTVKDIAVENGPSGAPSFYVVNLTPAGFVVVSADTSVEPILCFSGKGHFTPFTGDALTDVLQHDESSRLQSRASEDVSKSQSFKRGSNKWAYLLHSDAADSSTADATSILNSPGPSTVEVAPLIQSQWAQTFSGTGSTKYCYSYYTPDNYDCGCIATGLAQIMRHFQWPTGSIGTGSFGCTFNESPITLKLRGGDGNGGPYNYTEMPLEPDLTTTPSPTLTTEYQEIGDLCYDAGVASHMDYESDQSETAIEYAVNALENTFDYSNGVDDYFGSSFANSSTLLPAIYPDLDAGLPLLVGLLNTSTDGGHVVVADGYGYDAGTLYTHLNIGWGTTLYTSQSIWYNLADPDVTDLNYNVVEEILANIYINGTGEVFSGVVNAGQSPLPGATVTATVGSKTYQVTSGTNGIYAFVGVPSKTTYTVTASFGGVTSSPITVMTGESGLQFASDNQGKGPSGDSWGNKLTLPAFGPIVSSFSPSSVAAGVSATVVTITGSNLGGATSVTWNGHALTSLSSSGTSVTGTIAASFLTAAASAPFIVTTTGGMAISTNSFIVYAKPTITGISPTSGSVGSTITISGSNLATASSVIFAGGTSGISVAPLTTSATSLTVTMPAGSKTGVVSVVTLGGQATSTAAFTVAPSPTITSFSPTSIVVGGKLTIAGTNLTGAKVVTFAGGVTAVPTVASAASASVTVPAGAVTGVISITTPGGTATTTSQLIVIPPPTISGFTPSSGGLGTVVSITGTSFTGATKVTFTGGVSVAPTSVTATSLSATVPAGTATGPITVVTPSGTVVSSTSFTFFAAPKITSFTPATGPIGMLVTINGTNLTGTSAVVFTSGVSAAPASVSATQVTVHVPTGAKTGTFTVTASGGKVTSASVFTVIPPPTITSISPTSAPIGATIKLAGTSLTGATVVTFTGGATAKPSAVAATSVSVVVPATAKTGPVSVATPGGTAVSAASFTLIPPPTISGFTPSSGGLGTVVSITGTSFTGATKVTFTGGVSVAPTSVTATSLSATVPAGTATGPITVVTPSGTVVSSTSFTFFAAPKITSFTPATGPIGMLVTINGTNLTGTSAVVFTSGVSAAPASVSATQVTVHVPTGAKTGTFTVTASGGKVTSASVFTVIPPPTITSISPTSAPIGATIKLAGTSLTGATVVTFTGGATAKPSAVAATSVSVVVPATAKTGPVSVATPGGTAVSAASFTLIPPPTISGFTPSSGGLGTVVNITGTSFTGATKVTFTGGVSVAPTSVTATSLSATVPAGTATGPITVVTPSGTVVSSTSFTFFAAPKITSVTPATGPIGAMVTINGTNLTGTSAVVFTSGVSAAPVSVSATQVTVIVPTGTKSGTFTVTASGGKVTSASAFTVIPPPTITSISPTSLKVGAVVSISGTNLTGATLVTFASGLSVKPTSVAATLVKATVPSGAVTGVISVTTPGGKATSAGTLAITLVVTK